MYFEAFKLGMSMISLEDDLNSFVGETRSVPLVALSDGGTLFLSLHFFGNLRLSSGGIFPKNARVFLLEDLVQRAV